MSFESKSDSVFFHIKNKYTLYGFSIYDVILQELTLEYNDRFKRYVQRLERHELAERWKFPLVSDLCRKIEDEYGMSVKGIFINHYLDPDNYTPFHRDNYGGNGVFTISLGNSRMFYTKNDKTNEVVKHQLDDGDLFYFNSAFDAEHRHSIPKLVKFREPRISIVFFV